MEVDCVANLTGDCLRILGCVIIIVVVFTSMHMWVPVTTAWRVLGLRMEERPPIWRVAVNKLNKQPRTAEEGWSSSLGLGEVLTTPLCKKHMLRITHKLRCFLWEHDRWRALVGTVRDFRVP